MAEKIYTVGVVCLLGFLTTQRQLVSEPFLSVEPASRTCLSPLYRVITSGTMHPMSKYNMSRGNGEFERQQKAKYKKRAAINQYRILRGIHPVTIPKNYEMMDFLKLSGQREERVRKGHAFLDVIDQESLVAEDDDTTRSPRQSSSKSGAIFRQPSRDMLSRQASLKEHGIDIQDSGDSHFNIDMGNVQENAKLYMSSVADAANIETLVDFETVSPVYFGTSLLIMNYIGEVLYVNTQNELRCKPLNLLQSTDRVKFKIIDVRHSNASGPVHFGEQLWIQILSNSEVGDVNTFKQGVILAAKVQNLPLHDVAVLSGAPASTSNTKNLKKSFQTKNKSKLPSVVEDEMNTRPTASEKMRAKTNVSSTGTGDMVGHVETIRIADVRRVDSVGIDLLDGGDNEFNKAKRSYISRQSNFIGRWCIHSAMRDEDLTEKMKADRIEKTSENHQENNVVSSISPIVIQQDFYCLSTMAAEDFAYWPSESEDIVTNTNIFSEEENAEFEQFRKTDPNYAVAKAKSLMKQKHRGRARAVTNHALVADEEQSGVKKEVSLEEKLFNVDFGCIREKVERKFPYEYCVDRKCVWKFLHFEQFATKDGEQGDEDKIVHEVMETAKMVLKLSKLNREGATTYLPARDEVRVGEEKTVFGKHEIQKKMKESTKIYKSAAFTPLAPTQKGPTSQTSSKLHGERKCSSSSRRSPVKSVSSVETDTSHISALPPLRSGEHFPQTLRTITQINLSDIEGKYTNIRRSKELALKKHFNEKWAKVLAKEREGDSRHDSRKNKSKKMSDSASMMSTIATNESPYMVMRTDVGFTKPSRLAIDDGEFGDVQSVRGAKSSSHRGGYDGSAYFSHDDSSVGDLSMGSSAVGLGWAASPPRPPPRCPLRINRVAKLRRCSHQNL